MAKKLQCCLKEPEHAGFSRGVLFGGWRPIFFRVVALLLVLLICNGAFAYSVLTHEEIVDLVWTSELRPLLLQRFPGLSEEDLTEAHAYAYRGRTIHDIRSYPLRYQELQNCVPSSYLRDVLS